MNQSIELVSAPRADVATAIDIGNPSTFLFDGSRMRSLMDFADMMSKAAVTMPKHLQGKPSDCLAITLQAMRWRMDPYIVAAKTHIVNGNLGYEAQLVIAVLKNSGAVRGRPHYEYRGEGPALECRAGFVPVGEDAIVWTEWLASSSIAVKNSPLWKTNPKQQMGYVQARNWARLYAPEALLGIYTDDELASPAASDAQPTQRHMGMVDEVKPDPAPSAPTLPAYAADAFAANLPKWRDLVESGRKTGAALLATLATKATFSDEQRAAILALDAPDQAKQQAAAEPAAGPTDDELPWKD